MKISLITKQTQMVQKDKKETFFYLAILTSFFSLLEISYFLQCHFFYIDTFSNLSRTFEIPVHAITGILFFLTMQLLLHILFCLWSWSVSQSFIILMRIPRQSVMYVVIPIWFWGIAAVLVANQYYFPNSKWVDLTKLFLPNEIITTVVFYVLLTGCLILSFLALVHFIMRAKKWTLLLMIFFAAGLFYQWQLKEKPVTQNTLKKPNIILIGVDSLRPDFIQSTAQHPTTPFIADFVQRAAYFPKTITPIARTNPSWISILTGLHPVKNGVRTNLAKIDQLNFNGSLPSLLKKQGYKTIYASDETRFSNIDKVHGFDKILTPPMGLNDFLIGTLNDFPFSNLIVNTRMGQFMFPYSYANRAVAFTYDPDTFINMLQAKLKINKDQPLFFAIHFCLPHFPFSWRDPQKSFGRNVQTYEDSLQRVDKQVNDFYALLKERHLLNNAIVILLSDHGESLEISGDRVTKANLYVSATKSQPFPLFFPKAIDTEEVDQSVGHGTDILSLSQYTSVLAIRWLGKSPFAPKTFNVPVSLLDIKPTVLSMIGLADTQSDGRSLTPLIKGKVNALTPRHHLIETDFSPQAIRTIHPDAKTVLLQGIALFEVSALTNRLVVKDDMMKVIMKSKQYADLYDDWILALYPQDQEHFLPILVNLKTGQWTDKLLSKFAEHSPAALMLTQLKSFYTKDIDKVILMR